MKKLFEIKPEHLKLLQQARTGWDDCEFGAPEIDPKRPYGNSNVYQDMIEILGLKKVKNGIYKFQLNKREWLLKGEDENNIDLDEENELTDILFKLHKDLETVLQICLSTQKFETGRFEADEYRDNWKKLK